MIFPLIVIMHIMVPIFWFFYFRVNVCETITMLYKFHARKIYEFIRTKHSLIGIHFSINLYNA